MHTLGPQRIDGERRDDGRINAARQAEDDARKAVLVDIVAKTQRQPAIERAHAVIRRSHLAGQRRHTKILADTDDRGRLREAGEMRGQLAIGVQSERGTVIDQLVLPADHIHIDERKLGFMHTADSMRHARVGFHQIKRRGVQ